MSHSKRNTSRPVFTSYERQLAQNHWNNSTARLNRDSFLPFGSCTLCLEIARDPVSCPRGDIFCHECALANILAQKKEIKRAEKSRKELEDGAAQKAAAQEDEDRARAIRDFEMTQAGMTVQSSGHKHITAITVAPNAPTSVGNELVLAEKPTGTKRKLLLDEEEVGRNTRDDQVKARKAIDDEQAAKPSLPSFWTPSLTPDVHDTKVGPAAKQTKTSPLCPASSHDNPHHLSMLKLITIRFDEQEDTSTKDKRRTCPSCRKALSNASGAVLAKRCGHVLCKRCVKQFLAPTCKGQDDEEPSIIPCFVCDEPVAVHTMATDGPKPDLPTGFVSLRSEGTGFSAGGSSTVKKNGVSFQC